MTGTSGEKRKRERNRDKLELVLIEAENRWKAAIERLNTARAECEQAARDHQSCQRDLLQLLQCEVKKIR